MGANDNDVAARLNNEAAQRASEGGAKPLTGIPGQLGNIFGVNLNEGQGYLPDSGGPLQKPIGGIGSLFHGKGENIMDKLANREFQASTERSNAMHEKLQKLAASIQIFGVTGGENVGIISGPAATPAPPANDRGNDTKSSRSA